MKPATTCSHCGHVLPTAEMETRSCEKCGKPLPSAITPEAFTLPKYHGEAERPLPAVSHGLVMPSPRELLAWGTVRAGLAQIMVGLLLLLIGVGVVLLVVLATDRGGPLGVGRPGPNSAELAFLLLSGASAVVGIVLFVAGTFLCGAAPSLNRFWAIASILCLVVNTLLLGLFVLVQMENRAALEQRIRSDRVRMGEPAPRGVFRPNEQPLPRADEATVLNLVMQLVSYLQIGFFSLFLAGVARFFGDSVQAIHSYIFLAVFVVLGCANFVLGQTRFADLSPSVQESIQSVLLAGLILAAVLTVWFLILIGFVRGSITRGLLRRR